MNLGGSDKHIITDILVIGGGMAGLCAAIKAKEQGVDVTLVEKGHAGKTSGIRAFQGDYKVFDPEKGHKLEDWVGQVNRGGEYLNNQDWTEIVIQESYDRYKELISWGIEFYPLDKMPPTPRWEIMEHLSMVKGQFLPALRKKVTDIGVNIVDRIMASELIKQDGKVVGVIGFHTTSGDLYTFQAKATVIATGGSSLKLGHRPHNSWTADGEAMAYRAGAEISGKEFTVAGQMPFRADAEITGKDFTFGQMSYNRPDARLQQQTDEATGGAWKEVDSLYRFPRFGYALIPPVMPIVNAEGGPVIDPGWEAHCGRIPLYSYVEDLNPLLIDYIQHVYRKPGTTDTDEEGLEIIKGGKLKFKLGNNDDLVNVFGGAGIWPINKECASGVPGLYAAGVCCATMASGTNYPGPGYGLTHGAVTGARAGLGAARYAMEAKKTAINKVDLNNIKVLVCAPVKRKGGFSPGWITQIVHSITVPYFYLQIKHGERLQAALTLMEFVNSHLVPKIKATDAHQWRMAIEAKNMALDAEIRLRASLFRIESRGTHFREDYPRRDDPAWLAWVKVKDEQGKMKVSKEPIPEKWWPDLSEPYEKRYPRAFPNE
jgi:succinate dehydrogenase/fumarate reductase flavoprotein subunit